MWNRSFVEKTLERFAETLRNHVFAEQIAATRGWLQQMDTRVKAAGLLLLLISAAISHSLIAIAFIYVFTIILAIGSHVFSFSFLRRIWLFMPLYTAIIALPALFLTPGESAFQFSPGLTITKTGITTASFLILRVATSVSSTFLLVLTTPWPRLLKAFRSLGVPKIFVFLLAMTYRYVYLLLSTAYSLFQGRKSRRVGPESFQSAQQWTGSLLTTLIGRSFHLSSEVYLAMQARGFRGEPSFLEDFKMRIQDYFWMALFVGISVVVFFVNQWK